jgi:hypothetical protein
VYLYRAIDQRGQVIDVLASQKRDLAATRRFLARALNAARRPAEVTATGPGLSAVLDELVPEAWHVVEQYSNNPIEAGHGRLKARTRPMRDLKRAAPPKVSVAGTRSSRTCAVDTTTSASMPSPAAGSTRYSQNSPSPSEKRLDLEENVSCSRRNSALTSGQGRPGLGSPSRGQRRETIYISLSAQSAGPVTRRS